MGRVTATVPHLDRVVLTDGKKKRVGFLSSSLNSSVSFFHCSSYKYADMKYTLLLVVNDVLWYSLHLWIVLCLLCMMYYDDISIYDKAKK